MSPMLVSSDMFPGASALLAALDGGASLAQADIETTTTQARVFGFRKHTTLIRSLWQAEREQYLAEFRSAFEASI